MEAPPQAAPWIITAISAIGNLVQLAISLRKSASEADRSEAETDAIRQQIEKDALEQVRDLQAWMREQNKEIRQENVNLKRRVEVLEELYEALGRQLENERAAWRAERAELLRRLADIEDENREWRARIT
ncbi:MAG: hypothetical protein DRN91_04755 [Candidatus Alkanophagales archaeon]|nr:MAG: hypothetical protein DRN91_04755 [Candidatus Alkanophagales archaeon]